MPERSKAGSIDEYIAQAPPQARPALAEVRAIVRAAAPDAVETISYAIPTFDLGGRHLVHFAGYERHLGFYPTSGPIEAFRDELRQYKQARGSVQFPLDEPLPADLIRRIVEYRVHQLTGGT